MNQIHSGNIAAHAGRRMISFDQVARKNCGPHKVRWSGEEFRGYRRRVG
jgi:hypothetical protein